MSILRKASFTSFFRNLHPSLFSLGVVRPKNAFENAEDAMYSHVEPRSTEERVVQWKARKIGHEAQQNPEKEFYDLLDKLSDQVAVCQGLRSSKRFGNSSVQGRIMTAEDRIQSAIEILHNIRPDERDLLKEELEDDRHSN